MNDALNNTANSISTAPDFGGKLVEPQMYEDQNLIDDQPSSDQFIASTKKDEPPKT